jgi:hypothetical protein
MDVITYNHGIYIYIKYVCVYIYICIQNITRQKQKENWQGASKSIMDMACGISQKRTNVAT